MPCPSARELLARWQAELPDSSPEPVLRTLPRRLKQWRGDAARQLVFAAGSMAVAGSGDR